MKLDMVLLCTFILIHTEGFIDKVKIVVFM